eukprot:1503065-Prymnesium_polylepis.2
MHHTAHLASWDEADCEGSGCGGDGEVEGGENNDGCGGPGLECCEAAQIVHPRQLFDLHVWKMHHTAHPDSGDDVDGAGGGGGGGGEVEGGESNSGFGEARLGFCEAMQMVQPTQVAALQVCLMHQGWHGADDPPVEAAADEAGDGGGGRTFNGASGDGDGGRGGSGLG